MRLSACVCVHNEEQRLAQCLQALAFCDEIIVVLDRCTDNSATIAAQFTKNIITGSFPLEGDRRMAALNAASGEWRLEVDCDEFISPALASEIQSVIAQTGADWHLIPVDNYIGNRLVRYGWGASFGTSAVGRLSCRGIKHWGPQHVHPVVKMNGTKGAMLQNAIIHKVDDNLTDMMARLNRYTSLRALDIQQGLIGNPERETLGRNIGRFFSRFYKCYVGRNGRHEGLYGFTIALMAGLFPILSFLKARIEQSTQ